MKINLSEEVTVHLPMADAAPRPVWEEGVPRRRLREKTAPPQLSMFHMEGENCRWVQTWLSAHHEQFDGLGPTDHTLRSLEVSSDSWTLETPDRTSSSGGDSQEGHLEARMWRGRLTTRTVAQAWWPR